MPDTPPTSRIARTRRFGGLVAGQSLRWAGTRAANVLRSDERAEEATGERVSALARELVKQLGQMRGAATSAPPCCSCWRSSRRTATS